MGAVNKAERKALEKAARKAIEAWEALFDNTYKNTKLHMSDAVQKAMASLESTIAALDIALDKADACTCGKE